MADHHMTLLRASILNFPLIVGVVYIHNSRTAVHIGNGSVGAVHVSAWVDFVMFFISGGISSVAVPLFLLICVYLFFLKLSKWSWERYVGKIKRRIHTLLIPFIFWNLMSLLVYTIGQSFSKTKKYFVGTLWPPVDSSFIGYIGAMFGITTIFPIAGQFWFIRDLMALVVLAPVIYFILTRKIALPFLIVLFGLWYFNIWPVLWPNVFATFFFSLGAYLSLSGKNVAYLDRFGPWINLIFICLITLKFYLPESLTYPNILVIVFGVPSLWWLTKLAIRMATLKLWLLQLSEASFFIFAAHGQLELIIRKILYRMIVPTSGEAILALYFLIPIFLIALLVVSYRYLSRTTPSVLNFITGSSYSNRQVDKYSVGTVQ
jgi:hypothetical protein